MAPRRITLPAWPLVLAVLLAPSARAADEPAADPRAASTTDASPRARGAPAEPEPDAASPGDLPRPRREPGERVGERGPDAAPASPLDALALPDAADLPELGTVVRGTRRPQSAAALAPGAAVTVVDAARFAGEAKGAGELLATAPGVAVTDTGGVGRLATVSIRGASADQVRVLLDGVPLNPAAGGGVDLSSIPPQWIARIEIIRGTEGVHHGTGALGGVVNVITAAPRDGTWSAGVTGGSFGTIQADAQAGTGGAGWGLLGSVAGSRSDGGFSYVTEDTLGRRTTSTRTRNGSAIAGGLLKGFALAGGGRLDATAQLSGGSRDLPGRIGLLSERNWQEDLRGIGSVRFRRELGRGVFAAAAGSVRVDRLAISLEEIAGGAPLRQRGLAGAGTLSADWCGDRGALSAALEAGAERLAGDGTGDHVRETFAAVIAGEVTALAGRARLGPGVRLERQGRHAGVSAKLGGAVPLGGPLSLRASAGRTYRVPSFSELYLQQGILAPNPALRPEVGLGGDGALVVEAPLGTASVGGFVTEYRDLIVYQAVSFRRLTPTNADRSVVRGVEAELAIAPVRRLAGLGAQAAYTFTDSQLLRGREVQDGVGELGLDLPRRPRHRLYVRVAVGGPAADAHVEGQWLSRQWLALGEHNLVPEALTFGAGVSARLWRAAGLRLHVEARNLLDVRTLQDSYGNPLPGRTVLVTLRAGSSNTETP